MPEWRKLVKTRINALGLDPERKDEIVAELAGYLEDVYEAWLKRGATPEEAAAHALHQVPDWTQLRREIHHALRMEDTMNYRTKSLWLPGLISLTLSMGLLSLFNWMGFQPRIIWLHQASPLLFYLPWLFLLPAVGTVGAYWSRRAGGRLRERLLAGLFPAAALTALFFAILPVGILVDSHVALTRIFTALATSLLVWGVIPAALLLAGTLPFLKDHRPECS